MKSRGCETRTGKTKNSTIPLSLIQFYHLLDHLAIIILRESKCGGVLWFSATVLQ